MNVCLRCLLLFPFLHLLFSYNFIYESHLTQEL